MCELRVHNVKTEVANSMSKTEVVKSEFDVQTGGCELLKLYCYTVLVVLSSVFCSWDPRGWTP